MTCGIIFDYNYADQQLATEAKWLDSSEEMFYFQRLEFFEKFRQSQFLQVLRDSPNTAAGGVGNDDSCLLNDNVILNGQFFSIRFPIRTMPTACAS